MRAGGLRAVVQVLQPVVTNGVQTWNTPASMLCQTRARVDTTSGMEQPTNLGPANELMTNVHMRFRPGVQIQPRMRVAVLETQRTLEIDSVIDVEFRHRDLVLTCREVSP